PRFRLPVMQEQAEKLLVEALKVEVSIRHRTRDESGAYGNYVAEAAHFLTSGEKFGLIICGAPGNGKTTLMRSMQRLINAFHLDDRYGETLTMQWRTAKDIVWLAGKDIKAYDRLCDTQALAIDDLGEEPVEILDYGNVRNPVIDLLSNRYDKQLLTLVTTNTPNDKIRERYGDRIADRFNEMMQVIIFTNPSYRKQ
ncbi:MAG: hypothetical protein K2H16_07165, partial [Prevotella sp.]|nr:hypothetical protein [Prevotella sp.]